MGAVYSEVCVQTADPRGEAVREAWDGRAFSERCDPGGEASNRIGRGNGERLVSPVRRWQQSPSACRPLRIAFTRIPPTKGSRASVPVPAIFPPFPVSSGSFCFVSLRFSATHDSKANAATWARLRRIVRRGSGIGEFLTLKGETSRHG